MTNLTMRIHNVSTGEVIDKEMTDEEQIAHLAQIAEAQNKEAERIAKAAAREAVLEKLGLTAEEAAALLA